MNTYGNGFLYSANVVRLYGELREHINFDGIKSDAAKKLMHQIYDEAMLEEHAYNELSLRELEKYFNVTDEGKIVQETYFRYLLKLQEKIDKCINKNLPNSYVEALITLETFKCILSRIKDTPMDKKTRDCMLSGFYDFVIIAISSNSHLEKIILIYEFDIEKIPDFSMRVIAKSYNGSISFNDYLDVLLGDQIINMMEQMFEININAAGEGNVLDAIMADLFETIQIECMLKYVSRSSLSNVIAFYNENKAKTNKFNRNNVKRILNNNITRFNGGNK